MSGLGQRVVNSTARGVVGAMAMTGVRSFTGSMGLVGETPPEAVLRQKLGGLMKRIPEKRQQGVVEAFHWSTGAVAGAAFALLPAAMRRPPWAGAAYGLAVLSGFELAVAPLLGLEQARHERFVERLVFLVDHVLYGLVLSPPAHQHG
ncbi:MAG: hypothetical protein ACR2LX_06425 [Jatrophihabitans sp.]